MFIVRTTNRYTDNVAFISKLYLVTSGSWTSPNIERGLGSTIAASRALYWCVGAFQCQRRRCQHYKHCYGNVCLHIRTASCART